MTAQLRDTTDAELVSVVPTVTLGGSRFYTTFGKRAFDIAFVLMAAPLALSLVCLGVVLALASGVRPFYLQERIGKNQRTFRIVKIRTMVSDAEQVLETYLAENPEAREEWDEKQKLASDPRITRFGNFLRKTSLDELPQLWNVLKGDMSIVGPRPMMTCQKELYDQHDLRKGACYYSVRPGITGPWQVSDRSVGTFTGRVEFDAQYCRKLSFGEDMRLLVKTVSAVLGQTGR